MISLLQGIADFISTLASYFVSFLESFFNLFKYIGMAMATIGEAALYLPTDLTVIAMAFIGVAVVYLILGR